MIKIDSHTIGLFWIRVEEKEFCLGMRIRSLNELFKCSAFLTRMYYSYPISALKFEFWSSTYGLLSRLLERELYDR